MDRLLLEFGGILSGHCANPSLAKVGTKPRTLHLDKEKSGKKSEKVANCPGDATSTTHALNATSKTS
ncbi:hypothetical protein, partial [Corynebacterium sp. c24Ua_83]|uniref:hypothetical protein n=1 Tax=Corynebacterium sp. c24Ua_83 TaxID=3032350 RepID=UPI00326372E3